MRKNNVLIPMDGTEFSLQVLPLIQRFLNPTGNRLILLHVEKEPETIHIHRPGFEDLDIYVDQAEAALRVNFADSIYPLVQKLTAAGFEVTTDVWFGKPVHEIEAYIAHEQVDLVAMATHGRTGLGRVIFGSVAEHVSHHSKTPILLIHPVAEAKEAELPPLV